MCHALVIEDDCLMAEYVADLAGLAGATSCATAATQDDAVVAASERRPDIILSDVQLARGSGPEAVQTIFAQHGEMPVVFITGTPEFCRSCAPPGIVMSKPINEQAMIGAFRRLAQLSL